MVMWVMSDRGIPRSFRMMQGFGVDTCTLHTLAGEQFLVKFHWLHELGVHSWDEALRISGKDPAFPNWKFCIQAIPVSKEHDFDFDILDATKIWPEAIIPLEEIGELILDRKPEEFFPEVEQVAFCRNFSYLATQLSRLGMNWQELPVNRSTCLVLNHQRDAGMRHRITAGVINKHLIDAISFKLDHCDDPVVYQPYAKVLNCIDFELAKQVASNLYYFPKNPTIVERRIAILVADGFDLDEVTAVRSALSNAKARTFINGPRRGEIHPSGYDRGTEKGIRADHHFEGQRSTLFDALYIPSGHHLSQLAKPEEKREAFGHCKAIGATGCRIFSDVKTSHGVVATGKLDVKSTAAGTPRIEHDSKDFVAQFAYVISQMGGLTTRVAY
ncbi:catalase-like domain-containing protein [Russula compacta]|nr:catalase-like domain-containing protein [Russula compacta]